MPLVKPSKQSWLKQNWLALLGPLTAVALFWGRGEIQYKIRLLLIQLTKLLTRNLMIISFRRCAQTFQP